MGAPIPVWMKEKLLQSRKVQLEKKMQNARNTRLYEREADKAEYNRLLQQIKDLDVQKPRGYEQLSLFSEKNASRNVIQELILQLKRGVNQ